MFVDSTARNEAIAEAVRLRALGWSCPKIAAKLGTQRGFVEYHTMTPENKRRKLRAACARKRRDNEDGGGIRVCANPACGDEKRVTADHLRRIKAGTRSSYCQPCATALVRGGKLPDVPWPEREAPEPTEGDWRRPDELESVEAWARRVWDGWSELEQRMVAQALVALEVDDGSSFARSPGPAQKWAA